MSEKPRQQVDAATAATSHRSLEQKLSALRDDNRLLLHMWEEYEDPFTFPAFSWWRQFARMEAKEIAGKLEKPGKHEALASGHVLREHAPLTSLSLVPAKSLGAVTPFDEETDTLWPVNTGGCLVDADEGKEHPVRVLFALADLGTFYSGYVAEHKLFCPKEKLYDNAYQQAKGSLKDYYEQAGATGRPEAFIRFMGSASGPDMSGMQLDMLADDIAALRDGRHTSEVIAACAPEHIAAIVMPHAVRESTPQRQAFADAALGLAGALAGLEHGKRGIELPVVRYEYDGPDRGDIRVMAADRQEMIALLETSLGTLLSSPQLLQETDAPPVSELYEIVRDSAGQEITPVFPARGR
jgi:hypothetical protein